MLRQVLLLLGMFTICNGYRSVCYYTNWSQYRQGKGKYFPEHLEPQLCTHVIYSFGLVRDAAIYPFEWNDLSEPWMTGMYDRMMAMKQYNPEMKVLLAIGGWNMASEPFTAFAGSADSRRTFIDNAISFLRVHGFDGLDMDWEYPGSRGSPLKDRDHFVDLMRELREAFDQEAKESRMPRLLSTGAFPAGRDTLEAGYDLAALAPHMDFISIMSYDFHGAWDSTTGLNSPLFAHDTNVGDEREKNVQWAAEYYVSQGVPRDKLNIGIATYGRTFTLKDSSVHGVGAPVTGAGPAGPYTREAGYLAYYEVCELQQQGGQVYDVPSQRNRYLVSGRTWVGFDDVDSVKEKACYTKKNGYGGVMFWALDTDDFTGTTCGQGTYPLFRAVLEEMESPLMDNCKSPESHDQNQGTSHPDPGITPGQPIIEDPPSISSTGHFNCSGKVDDYYSDPKDCSSYYICANQMAYHATCGQGLKFNPLVKTCDFPHNVVCASGDIHEAPQAGGPVSTARPDVPQTSTHVPVPTPTLPSTAPPKATTTPAETVTCRTPNGLQPFPGDCSRFVQCHRSRAHVMKCPPTLAFSDTHKGCDYARNVPGC